MSIKKWLDKNTHDLAGKVVVITGSTGGIGRQVCSMLADLNAELVFVDRNLEKSEKFAQEIKALHPNAKISHVISDLEDIASMKQATEKLKQLEKIDFLLLNSGAYAIPRNLASTGFDNVFQINFLSHYFMVKELLPLIRKSKGKVVATSSIAHNYGKLDEADIDYKTRKKPSKVYGNSKRFLTFALMKLFETETDTTLSIVHPGITFTNITNHYPKAIYALIKHPMKLIFISNKIAALNVIKGIFTTPQNGCWIGPSVFNIWGYPKSKKLKTATEHEKQKIFEIAENLYKKIETQIEV